MVRDYKCNVLKHDVLGNNKSKSNYPLCYLAHKPVLRKFVKGFTKIKKYNTVHIPLISFNKMNEINLKRNNPSESVLALIIIFFFLKSSCLKTVLEFFWESEANSRPLTRRICHFPFWSHQMSISIQQQPLCHLSMYTCFHFSVCPFEIQTSESLNNLKLGNTGWKIQCLIYYWENRTHNSATYQNVTREFNSVNGSE